jgi:hypothetical protein
MYVCAALTMQPLASIKHLPPEHGVHGMRSVCAHCVLVKP